MFAFCSVSMNGVGVADCCKVLGKCSVISQWHRLVTLMKVKHSCYQCSRKLYLFLTANICIIFLSYARFILYVLVILDLYFFHIYQHFVWIPVSFQFLWLDGWYIQVSFTVKLINVSIFLVMQQLLSAWRCFCIALLVRCLSVCLSVRLRIRLSFSQ